MSASGGLARPSVIWIELTSRCPLDCIFCSRKTVRGTGEHMAYEVAEGILADLGRPEIVRLNYSGESINHPRLLDVIRVAKRTGAQVELVTSLVSMPLHLAGGLVRSGLDRLSISLHSLDAEQFPEIYGYASLSAFRQRLDAVLAAKRESGAHAPVIDFAFVAMERNLDQIRPVAELAVECGAPAVSIHPVIKRDLIPLPLDRELNGEGNLRPEFAARLEAVVSEAGRNHPGLRVSIARPDGDQKGCAGSHTCEQNPFETAHILANGDVVVCEVLDKASMGNVRERGLAEVWNGAQYQEFRNAYHRGGVEACRRCAFRAPAEAVGVATAGWGWHRRDETDTLWSKRVSSFTCEAAGHPAVRIEGALPAATGGQANTLRISCEGKIVGCVENAGDALLEFEMALPLDSSKRATSFIAEVSQPFSPWRMGQGEDTRELGFALFAAERCERAELAPAERVRTRSAGAGRGRALMVAAGLGLLAPLATLFRAKLPAQDIVAPAAGVTVLILERDTPEMLGRCLDSLADAAEIVVLVNGADPAKYADLAVKHPACRFRFHADALGFSSAVRMGLTHVTTGWVYLLNSDMALNADALARVMEWSGPDVFSVASRIVMRAGKQGVETNRTSIEVVQGIATIKELEPGSSDSAVEHVYSGGGCSLFQTEWLRAFAEETVCYDPFYWEDVEWGARARQAGLRNLFVASSVACHERRGTISRFYEEGEIARVFERNRLQFQLRCLPEVALDAVRDRLLHAPERTVAELLSPARLLTTARVRGCFRRRD